MTSATITRGVATRFRPLQRLIRSKTAPFPRRDQGWGRPFQDRSNSPGPPPTTIMRVGSAKETHPATARDPRFVGLPSAGNFRAPSPAQRAN